MTAGANDQDEALPGLLSEETLTIPEGWLRSLHPRRGGTAVAPVKASKGAVKKAQAYLDERHAAVEALSGRVGNTALAKSALRHLEGDADPAGAAVLALLAGMDRSQPDLTAAMKAFTDSWVIEHGLAFAACAVVEIGSLEVVDTRPSGGSDLGVRHSKDRLVASDVRACARRVRTLLATAEDAEYEQAVERLAGVRDDKLRRLAVSYLVPTRHDWVAESCVDIAAHGGYHHDSQRRMLYLTLGTAGHVAAMGTNAAMWWTEITVEVVTTLLDGLGTDALPIFVESLETAYLESSERRRLLETIGVLPTDEAFQALLDRVDQKHVQPALLAMANRFPARAVRMLADADVTLRARGERKAAIALESLLEGHLRAHADVAAAVRPGLPEQSQAVLAALTAASERVPEAPSDALPPLLTDPPWTRPRKAAKPVVIQGLPVPDDRGLAWAAGEHDAWAARTLPRWGRVFPADTDWGAAIAAYRTGSRQDYSAAHLIAEAPEELARPLLSEWEGFAYWDIEDVPWMKYVVTRYGSDALPLILKAAKGNPTSCSKLLLPFLDAGVAAQMAGWLERAKLARNTAMSWFDRHGVRAARLLIPSALGRAGTARRQAEGALLLIAARTGDEEIVRAAREHGDAAAEAIAALLATDPLDRLPAKKPPETPWADPVRLPQVLLRESGQALAAAAVRHLITMLAISKPGEVYAGVDAVRELCDPDSLAAFSWGLFQEWERGGAPSQDGWALHQLAWLGDDETVRRLTPVIRAWPGEGGHQKAVNGLDVLAAVGSDVALLHLHGIAQKVKFKGLKTRAQEKIAEVATGLGLSAEQLADRLVPDFGLDADGGMTLDYGPRRFTVGFDEQLRPYVTDEDGKRRKALPKPGAKDDQELAPAAYKRFAGLKKDVRTVAADQVHRLESAMVARRRWTPAEFRSLFVEHPLIWHMARRVVWLAEAGGVTRAFRLAEDRTFADADDDAFTLPEDASIGIAHPLDLGQVEVWSEVFADYEILQPFPQLGREVHVLAEEERTAGRLTRFEGVKVPVHTVLGLVRRGWERGMPLDGGVERWISKPVPGGLHVVIDLDMGISAGYAQDSDDQTLHTVWINDRPDDFWPRKRLRHTFGELGPVIASEVLADLTWLSQSAL